MNKRNSTLAIIAAIAALVLAAGAASALTPSGATVGTNGDKGQLAASAAGTVNLDAGNVTYADISADMSTLKWAGVYGNATGNLVLGDSAGNQLYTWTARGNLVYFSNAAVTNWNTLASAGGTFVNSTFPWLTQANATDTYGATFTGANSSIGSQIFPSLNAPYASTLSTVGNAWKTYSLKVDTTTAVFAGHVDPGNTAYDGSAADYQVILPENGTGSNDGVPTPWDVYVELI